MEQSTIVFNQCGIEREKPTREHVPPLHPGILLLNTIGIVHNVKPRWGSQPTRACTSVRSDKNRQSCAPNPIVP